MEEVLFATKLTEPVQEPSPVKSPEALSGPLRGFLPSCVETGVGGVRPSYRLKCEHAFVWAEQGSPRGELRWEGDDGLVVLEAQIVHAQGRCPGDVGVLAAKEMDRTGKGARTIPKPFDYLRTRRIAPSQCRTSPRRKEAGWTSLRSNRRRP